MEGKEPKSTDLKEDLISFQNIQHPGQREGFCDVLDSPRLSRKLVLRAQSPCQQIIPPRSTQENNALNGVPLPWLAWTRWGTTDLWGFREILIW